MYSEGILKKRIGFVTISYKEAKYVYYPIALNIAQKKVVIIGGGVIATQKLRTLRGYDAAVTVIAPTLTEEGQTLLAQLNGQWLQRSFEETDVVGAFIIFIATNCLEVNEAVSAAVSPQQIVLRADDVSKGNMLNQAVVRRGPLSIAVCTDGASPSLTRKLKRQLDEQFPPHYDTYVHFLAQARQEILATVPAANRRTLLQQLVDEELEQLVLAQQQEQAWALVRTWIQQAMKA